MVDFSGVQFLFAFLLESEIPEYEAAIRNIFASSDSDDDIVCRENRYL